MTTLCNSGAFGALQSLQVWAFERLVRHPDGREEKLGATLRPDSGVSPLESVVARLVAIIILTAAYAIYVQLRLLRSARASQQLAKEVSKQEDSSAAAGGASSGDAAQLGKRFEIERMVDAILRAQMVWTIVENVAENVVRPDMTNLVLDLGKQLPQCRVVDQPVPIDVILVDEAVERVLGVEAAALGPVRDEPLHRRDV